MSTRCFTISFVLLAVAGCPLGRKGKVLGESCRTDNDCAAAQCTISHEKASVDGQRGPLGVCTVTCLSDADCASAQVPMTCGIKPDPVNNPENRGTCAVKAAK